MEEKMQKIFEELTEENKNILILVANAIRVGQESKEVKI